MIKTTALTLFTSNDNIIVRIGIQSVAYSLGRIDIGQIEEVVAHGAETGQDLGERRHDQVLSVTAIGIPR